MTIPSRKTPTSPQPISIARLVRTRESLEGSGLQPLPSSLGVFQKSPSETNETTSTAAAAQPNSQAGIGRSALPVSPCAAAGSGATPRPARAPAAPPRTMVARALHGLTASLAIWVAVSSTSISKRRRWSRGGEAAGCSGADVLRRRSRGGGSRPVVGRRDGDRDVLALGDRDCLDATVGLATDDGQTRLDDRAGGGGWWNGRGRAAIEPPHAARASAAAAIAASASSAFLMNPNLHRSRNRPGWALRDSIEEEARGRSSRARAPEGDGGSRRCHAEGHPASRDRVARTARRAHARSSPRHGRGCARRRSPRRRTDLERDADEEARVERRSCDRHAREESFEMLLDCEAEQGKERERPASVSSCASASGADGRASARAATPTAQHAVRTAGNAAR